MAEPTVAPTVEPTIEPSGRTEPSSALMGLVPTFRRLFAVLFVAVACVVVGPSTGAAPATTAAAPCSCANSGGADASMVQDQVREAAAVFTGTVEKITPAGGNAENGFSRTSTVRVDRVYKGGMITTETVEVVTTRAFTNCNRDLQQDETYVFFVESDEGFTAPACGGTTRATTHLIDQVERLLGAGRDPVPPAPPSATFFPENTDDPTSLTRVAAPGLALVIVGLLGLAVVRRLGRPRP